MSDYILDKKKYYALKSSPTWIDTASDLKKVEDLIMDSYKDPLKEFKDLGEFLYCLNILKNKNPSKDFKKLLSKEEIKDKAPILGRYIGMPRNGKVTDVFDHVMDVLERTENMSTSISERYAALWHDIGKTIVPKVKWPNYEHHNILGAKVIGSLDLPPELIPLTQYISFVAVNHSPIREITERKNVEYAVWLIHNIYGGDGWLYKYFGDICVADKGQPLPAWYTHKNMGLVENAYKTGKMKQAKKVFANIYMNSI